MELPKGRGISVGAYIKRRDGKILILKRPLSSTTPGIWEIAGGNLEWGEDPFEGARREVKEETTLDVKITKPIDIISYVADRYGETRHIIQIVFDSEPIDDTQEVKINEEHTEFKWVTLEEMKGLYICFFFQRLLADQLITPEVIS